MKGIHETIKPVSLIAPHSHSTADETHNGQASGNVGHDISQYKAKEIGVLIHTGALNDGGSLAVTFRHGDVVGTGDSSYATIQNGAGTNATKTIAGNGDDNKVFLARFRAERLKKYLDVQIVQTGAVAMIYGAVLLVGSAMVEAIAQAAGVVIFDDKP